MSPPSTCAALAESRQLIEEGYLGRALRRLDRAEASCAADEVDALRQRTTAQLTLPGNPRREVSAEDRRKASLLYRDAVHRRATGDSAGAIRELERSFALYPHPLILVQMGVAQRDAGRDVDARISFARALHLAETLAGAPATPSLVRGHAGLIGLTRAIAFAPDGSSVVTGATDPYAIAWDATTGRPITRFGLHDFWINDVAISPDGTLAASVAGDGHLRAWDRASEELVFDLRIAPRQAMALVFTPDSGTIVVGDGSGALHWVDVATATVTRTVTSGHRSAMALALDPDGGLLASAHEDGHVQLVRVADGAIATSFAAHRDQCWDLVFSRDGATLYTGGQDGAVRTWHRDGSAAAVVRRAGAPVSALALSRDGVLAVSDTKTISLLPPAGEDRSIPAHAFDLAFSADGARLASAGSAGAALWNVATGERVHALASTSPPIRSLAVTPDGQLITSDNESLRWWPLNGEGAPRPIGAPDQEPGRVAVDPAGELLAVASGDQIALYPLSAVDAAPRVLHAVDRIEALAFAGDAGTLGVASGRGLEVFDARSGKRTGHYLIGRKVTAIAMRADGTRAAAAVEREAVLVDLAARTEGARLIGHLGAVVPAFVSTGVATGGHDHRVGLWTSGGRLQRWLRGHQRAIWTIAASSRGDRLLTASSEGYVRLWRVADGTHVLAIHAHDSWVSGLAFLPGDEVVVTAAHEGTIRLWRASDGEQVAVMTASTSGAWLVATPDGRVDGSDGADALLDWRAGSIRLPGFVGWQRNREPGLLRRLR